MTPISAALPESPGRTRCANTIPRLQIPPPEARVESRVPKAEPRLSTPYRNQNPHGEKVRQGQADGRPPSPKRQLIKPGPLGDRALPGASPASRPKAEPRLSTPHRKQNPHGERVRQGQADGRPPSPKRQLIKPGPLGDRALPGASPASRSRMRGTVPGHRTPHRLATHSNFSFQRFSFQLFPPPSLPSPSSLLNSSPRSDPQKNPLPNAGPGLYFPTF
ncbi:hypothetical protein GALL_09290 [mine drainage metagenome]|uniref:Uncharacterized protein n=1 Tax=mine drainage metagenome TaxID=410659 RepID=A0A1J5TQR0_9ZZZZ